MNTVEVMKVLKLVQRCQQGLINPAWKANVPGTTVTCVCGEPYSDKALFVQCCICSILFHPLCINMALAQAREYSQTQHFKCGPCHRATSHLGWRWYETLNDARAHTETLAIELEVVESILQRRLNQPHSEFSGLRNASNVACWFNSALQCLYNIETFRCALLERYLYAPPRTVTAHCGTLFSLMREQSVTSPEAFYAFIEDNFAYTGLRPLHQFGDAHEAFLFVTEQIALDSELRLPLHFWFGESLTCGHNEELNIWEQIPNSTPVPFKSVILSPQAQNVQKGVVDYFLKPEPTQVNGSLRSCIQEVLALPTVLVVVFPRFRTVDNTTAEAKRDSEANGTRVAVAFQQNRKRVQLEAALNLNCVVFDAEGDVNTSNVRYPSFPRSGPHRYELRGVVIYEPSTPNTCLSGHWHSFLCRNLGQSGADGPAAQVLKMNDSTVTTASFKDIPQHLWNFAVYVHTPDVPLSACTGIRNSVEFVIRPSVLKPAQKQDENVVDERKSHSPSDSEISSMSSSTDSMEKKDAFMLQSIEECLLTMKSVLGTDGMPRLQRRTNGCMVCGTLISTRWTVACVKENADVYRMYKKNKASLCSRCAYQWRIKDGAQPTAVDADYVKDKQSTFGADQLLYPTQWWLWSFISK